MHVKLGEICDLKTGGTPSRSHKEYFENGTIKWLVSGDIHKGEIYDCDGRITETGLTNSNARILPVNSVMIALNGQGKTRATVAMLRTEATCNQSLVSIYPKDTSKVLPEWIYWNLKGRYDELRRLTGDAGNERRGLNMIIIRNINLPTPPAIEEQLRIVAKLSAAFEEIDRAIDLVRINVLNALNTYKSASYAIFDKPEESSQESTLGELLIIERGGSPRPIKDYITDDEEGLNWIKIGDVKPGAKYIESTQQKIKPSGLKKSRYVKEGDFLLSNSMSFGRPYIMKTNGCIHDGWLLLRPKDESIDRDYLYYFLGSGNAYKQFDHYASGSTVRNLNTQSVAKVKIHYPTSRMIQRSLVKRLEKISIETESLKMQYLKKVQLLQSFKQSMLAQAFSQSDVK